MDVDTAKYAPKTRHCESNTEQGEETALISIRLCEPTGFDRNLWTVFIKKNQPDSLVLGSM